VRGLSRGSVAIGCERLVLEGRWVLVLRLREALWHWHWRRWWLRTCARDIWYELLYIRGVYGQLGMPDCCDEKKADQFGVCEGSEVCAFLMCVSANMV
jgi:hypothetical protein